jgi:hypothetical protein
MIPDFDKHEAEIKRLTPANSDASQFALNAVASFIMLDGFAVARLNWARDDTFGVGAFAAHIARGIDNEFRKAYGTEPPPCERRY